MLDKQTPLQHFGVLPVEPDGLHIVVGQAHGCRTRPVAQDHNRTAQVGPAQPGAVLRTAVAGSILFLIGPLETFLQNQTWAT